MFLKSILFILCLLCTPACFAEVFITSVLPNTIDDTNLEYIELYNSSGSSVDISGYSLSDLSGKEYFFGSGTILETKVFTQYLRPETKIILNNTNEEVFLKDSLGELVDSISYASSVKGEKITFLEKLNQESIFSQEAFISGEPIISDEVELGNESTIPTEIFVPEVSWSFQQPSYFLDKSPGLSEYFCDREKDECKINFDFRPSFLDVGESGYECLIDFGFPTGEEQKCNPNTITFPDGDFELTVKIISQADRNIFSEKKIVVHNTQIHGESNSSSSTTDQDISGAIGSPPLVLEYILYDFQSPSYVFSSGEDRYFCDREKENCKVNLDLRPSFIGQKESDYFCRLNFGFITGEEDKCNPATIEVPLGEHSFLFEIFSKATGEKIAEKSVYLSNQGPYPIFQKPLSVSRSYEASDFINIKKPQIIIQSGLIEKDGKYYCEKKICKVNLEYSKQDDTLRCIWDFGDGVFKESSMTRCNPGIIEYEGGIHRITLRVYQSNNKTNYFESRLVFENFPEGEITGETLQEEGIFTPQEEIHVAIVLQGKIGKNKTLSGNTLECFTKENCSVNLTSELSYTGSLKKSSFQFYWDFGNGETFLGENPKAFTFSFGEYEIHLVLKNAEEILEKQSFIVYVKKEEKIVKEKIVQDKKNKVFSGSLALISLLPNPSGNDIREWVEVQNTGITDIQLSECYLKNGSKKSKFPEEVVYPFETQKIFKVFSNFSLGNSKDELELYCGDIFQGSFMWREKIPEGSILFSDGKQIHQNYNFSQEDFKNQEDYRDFVEKTWRVNVRKLKTGVKISGETLAYTRVTIRSSQGKNIFVNTDQNGLFEILLDTQISVGEVYFFFEFEDTTGNFFSFFEEEVFQISSLDRNNFLAKYVKKVRKKKTTASTIKTKTLAVAQEKKDEILSSLSFLQKISFTFALSFLVLLLGIFLIPVTPRNTPILELYSKMFEVKQRVNLIL